MNTKLIAFTAIVALMATPVYATGCINGSRDGGTHTESYVAGVGTGTGGGVTFIGLCTRPGSTVKWNGPSDANGECIPTESSVATVSGGLDMVGLVDNPDIATHANLDKKATVIANAIELYHAIHDPRPFVLQFRYGDYQDGACR